METQEEVQIQEKDEIEKKQDKKQENKKTQDKKQKKKTLLRKPMPSISRMITLSVVIILLGIATVLAYLGTQERIEETEVLEYSYSFTGDSKYRVKFIPNDLYPEEWQDEGRVYSSKLTDVISVDFLAELKTSKDIVLTGDYYIEAVLSGFQKNEVNIPIYDRKYRLKEGKITQELSDSVKIEENVEIHPIEFSTVVTQIEEILGGTTDKEFYLLFAGTVRIEDKDYPKEKSFEYKVNLPADMKNAFYSISKPEAIHETEEINISSSITYPYQTSYLVLAGFLGILGILGFIWIVVFTRKPNQQEFDKIKQRKVLHKNGSRMIAVREVPSTTTLEEIYIEDMESLFMVADEVRQPVLYSLGEDGLPKEGKYYLFVQNRVYIVSMV